MLQVTPLLRTLLLTALIPALFLASCGKSSRPVELSKAEQLASAGDFKEAEILLERLRFRPGLDEQIAATRRRVARYREMHAGVERELRESIAERGPNKTVLFARERAAEEQAVGNVFLAEVWRKRMSSIREIAKDVEQRSKPDDLGEMAVPQDSSPEALGRDWSSHDREIEEFVKAGNYREAIERIREIMPTAGDDASRFRDMLWKVEAKGRKAITKIVEAAEAIEKSKSSDAALLYLAKEGERFPQFGVLGGVEQARRRLLKDLGRAKEIPWGPGMGVGVRGEKKRPDNQTPIVPSSAGDAVANGGGDTGSRWRARRSLDASADKAFAARDYASAAADWRQAVRFSEGLEAERVFADRAVEAEILQSSVDALASAVRESSERFRRVELGGGTTGKLVGFEDGRLVAEIRGQRERVTLKSIPDRAFAQLLSRAATTPLHRLGAASMYARAFDAVEAEKILAAVLREAPRAKQQVDRLLASLRKEDPGPGGYTLEGKRFVSSREIARRQLLAEYRPRLNKIWSAADDKKRDALVTELTSEGDAIREILLDATRAKHDELRVKLDKSKVGKQLDKLLVDRTALEARRKDALALIFDTEKYFYPYRDRLDEYRPVQLEVDRLCNLVREVWNDEARKVSVKGSLSKDLGLYRWTSRSIEQLAGESVSREDRWLWAMAPEGATTIRNVARNARERKFLDRGAAVLETNAVSYDQMRVDKSATGPEIDLMQRTNAYRLLMGRIPLRADARIVLAARGHCEEMSRLGYFGHTSPVPERKTPSDRMRLAGYERGVGENLAINASPEGAIRAWQRSSGHHRNMLAATHRDIGGGVHGRHYNQNFGAGLR